LRTFPVSRLKIDKMFVRNLETSESDREVTSAVISLGQKLKMKVIAEGVETEGQLAFLRECQCDEVQGFYFGRPLPAEAIEPLLVAPLSHPAARPHPVRSGWPPRNQNAAKRKEGRPGGSDISRC
jgi:EAL domain-containing protein (putative c-di-GMP-specific phosphodiesterase class I)